MPRRRPASRTTKRTDLVVYTDASTSCGHVGIGIYVPDLDARHAEGLIKPIQLQSARAPINWAELSAIKRALQLYGDHPLVIKTDSEWCMKMCRAVWRPTRKNPTLHALVYEVRKLILASKARVHWIPREENEVADSLATWASGYRISL